MIAKNLQIGQITMIGMMTTTMMEAETTIVMKTIKTLIKKKKMIKSLIISQRRIPRSLNLLRK